MAGGRGSGGRTKEVPFAEHACLWSSFHGRVSRGHNGQRQGGRAENRSLDALVRRDAGSKTQGASRRKQGTGRTAGDLEVAVSPYRSKSLSRVACPSPTRTPHGLDLMRLPCRVQRLQGASAQAGAGLGAIFWGDWGAGVKFPVARSAGAQWMDSSSSPDLWRASRRPAGAWVCAGAVDCDFWGCRGGCASSEMRREARRNIGRQGQRRGRRFLRHPASGPGCACLQRSRRLDGEGEKFDRVHVLEGQRSRC